MSSKIDDAIWEILQFAKRAELKNMQVIPTGTLYGMTNFHDADNINLAIDRLVSEGKFTKVKEGIALTEKGESYIK